VAAPPEMTGAHRRDKIIYARRAVYGARRRGGHDALGGPAGLDRAPIGAASVLYTSNTWYPDESDWLAGLVARSEDTYRVAEWTGAAGMSAVLSPDGSRLAFDSGIADLATGEVTGWGPGGTRTSWWSRRPGLRTAARWRCWPAIGPTPA
jgi:hypothetical protein